MLNVLLKFIGTRLYHPYRVLPIQIIHKFHCFIHIMISDSYVKVLLMEYVIVAPMLSIVRQLDSIYKKVL